MSDLYLEQDDGLFDLVIENGLPELTGGLGNAIILSLLLDDWWGNDIAGTDEEYNSEIPEILSSGILGNQTRLDVIEAAGDALAWMVEAGIVERFDIEAEIPEKGRIYLLVKIYEPEAVDPEEFSYSLNWENQKVKIQEAVW